MRGRKVNLDTYSGSIEYKINAGNPRLEILEWLHDKTGTRASLATLKRNLSQWGILTLQSRQCAPQVTDQLMREIKRLCNRRHSTGSWMVNILAGNGAQTTERQVQRPRSATGAYSLQHDHLTTTTAE